MTDKETLIAMVMVIALLAGFIVIIPVSDSNPKPSAQLSARKAEIEKKQKRKR